MIATHQHPRSFGCYLIHLRDITAPTRFDLHRHHSPGGEFFKAGENEDRKSLGVFCFGIIFVKVIFCFESFLGV